MNGESLLAVTDNWNKCDRIFMCAHLLSKEGALVKSIGKEVLGHDLGTTTFDLKGNVSGH